jgi:N-methylhydantoinase B
MRTDKHDIPAVGVEGGADGRTGACVINPGSGQEKRLPSRFGDYIRRRDDLLRVERPGGGGFGDPFARRPEKVLEDVRQGYVSIAAAGDLYGVAVAAVEADWRVEEEATSALRKRQKKAGKKNRPLL